jgi:hypothetical protein
VIEVVWNEEGMRLNSVSRNGGAKRNASAISDRGEGESKGGLPARRAVYRIFGHCSYATGATRKRGQFERKSDAIIQPAALHR